MAKQELWDVRYWNQDGEDDGYYFRGTKEEAKQVMDYLTQVQKREPDSIHDLDIFPVKERALSMKDLWEALHEKYELE